MGRKTETHVAVDIITMVTVNVGVETNIPVNSMHGRRKAKLIALMGLGFRKYI